MMENLDKILYDPFSYIHPQRLRLNNDLISTPICRSIVNTLIFDIFQLTDADIKINVQDKFWIQNWYNLPQIAFLIGCHINREKLMWKGRILSIPIEARGYLKIAPSIFHNDLSLTLEYFTHYDILNMGFSVLMKYIDRLPVSLRQRFPLLFPDCIDKIDTKFTVNPFLLRVISKYVETNKFSMPSERCRWCSCKEKDTRSE
ncbi:type III secretion apparatus protein OrgA/MxiK [Yersinia enterocolitica]|uniref:type III secretion apparatus protein OrgA/MxiK n=1 Tax=Yersinia enterocolitica TaxID=630 RepID=UPI00398D1492